MKEEKKEQLVELAKSLCEERGCFLVFLKIGGSVSYGINKDESDIDIRGVFIESPNTVIGINAKKREENIEYHREENGEHKDGIDLVLYPLQKFCSLACQANPNIVELLADDGSLVLYMTEYGKRLIDNRKLFLSKECIKSYGGYLTSERIQVETHLTTWQKKKLDKYLAHIFRLYESVLYLLETGDVMCKLPEDLANNIIEIREGSLTYKDWDTISVDVKKFDALFNSYETKFEELKNTSSLPVSPDRDGVNQLLGGIYMEYLNSI